MTIKGKIQHPLATNFVTAGLPAIQLAPATHCGRLQKGTSAHQRACHLYQVLRNDSSEQVSGRCLLSVHSINICIHRTPSQGSHAKQLFHDAIHQSDHANASNTVHILLFYWAERYSCWFQIVLGPTKILHALIR